MRASRIAPALVLTPGRRWDGARAVRSRTTTPSRRRRTCGTPARPSEDKAARRRDRPGPPGAGQPAAAGLGACRAAQAAEAFNGARYELQQARRARAGRRSSAPRSPQTDVERQRAVVRRRRGQLLRDGARADRALRDRRRPTASHTVIDRATTRAERRGRPRRPLRRLPRRRDPRRRGHRPGPGRPGERRRPPQDKARATARDAAQAADRAAAAEAAVDRRRRRRG